jgi:hypothetical protein
MREGLREVGAFGHETSLRLSSHFNFGGYDTGKLFDAEAEDMLRVPPGVGGIAAACARGQGPVPRLHDYAHSSGRELLLRADALVSQGK